MNGIKVPIFLSPSHGAWTGDAFSSVGKSRDWKITERSLTTRISESKSNPSARWSLQMICQSEVLTLLTYSWVSPRAPLECGRLAGSKDMARVRRMFGTPHITEGIGIQYLLGKKFVCLSGLLWRKFTFSQPFLSVIRTCMQSCCLMYNVLKTRSVRSYWHEIPTRVSSVKSKHDKSTLETHIWYPNFPALDSPGVSEMPAFSWVEPRNSIVSSEAAELYWHWWIVSSS